jgi:hypothetical protein
MPSRKQRKRRQKELRHEYEFVVVDEEGHEVEVDPDELREQRAEKERSREQARGKDGKGRDAAKGGRGSARPVRVVPPPSWSRTWKRALAFTAVMFLALSFLAPGGSPVSRVVLTLLYGGLFVPFLYLMDRVQYRQYLRRTGKTAEAPKQRSSGRAAGAAPKTDGGRRGLRRWSRS